MRSFLVLFVTAVITLGLATQAQAQSAVGVTGVAFVNLLPYLVVLAVILVLPTWGIWVLAKRREKYVATKSN
jgi:hypothetical protein